MTLVSRIQPTEDLQGWEVVVISDGQVFIIGEGYETQEKALQASQRARKAFNREFDDDCYCTSDYEYFDEPKVALVA